MERKPYAMEVEAMDLGPGVKATGVELIGRESREPVRGEEATQIWAAVFPALAGGEFFVLDFFSHLDRVREFCLAKGISFREEAGRCLVVPQPLPEQLTAILARFSGETFGVRAGNAAREGDCALEGDLSRRGLEAYQAAYARHVFCGVCEAEDGWLTLLSETLWPSEVIRRVRPAVSPLDVEVARPH